MTFLSLREAQEPCSTSLSGSAVSSRVKPHKKVPATLWQLAPMAALCDGLEGKM
jgi:hypothetical protein